VRKLTDTLDQGTVVKAVRDATTEVFTTMLGLELEAGEPYVETNTPGPTEGVASLVGLAGTWTGTGSIYCSAAFACKICSQFLMTEFHSVDEEVLDAVAELANMIVGNFKNIIEPEIGPLMLSIPTVVFGRNFTTRNLGKHNWTVIPFQCGEERLDVQICLVPNREAIHGLRPGFAHPHPVHT
jgi:chemotaxis protein CheX